ncbi:trehalose-phosphatase [Hephaestia sp. GCM10023244]|uniref:trehalose-phosphatase n=1 Tax=unclassified Hephaestia TaxID=2631281 RepID=UPI00207791AF|nr:trehalose-phosphatase [Hephaestia sp. MAHUQ-44]MCM8730508.1 trehalose-phosphatase [Hephaestia sp. MAHUQ-44]
MAVPDLAYPPADLLDGASLFLDFDGTLVDLADRPGDVAVDPALVALLDRLARRLDNRIALVSGRSLAQLDGFFGEGGKALAMIGSHGAETRHLGGAITRPDRPSTLDAAQALIAATFAGHAGVLIEQKSLGVGIHYRLDPSIEAEAHALADQLGAAHGLEVQHGKMMVELRLPGFDKGSAIAALRADPPFVGTRPIFLGDDLTDEPGFVACVAGGGAGILVGALRDTAATYRLNSVAAVRTWLKEAAR